MKIAIMQPYIFPYIGYFQLIHAVDTFVFYDDVHFIKKGWINRNRILVGKKEMLFSVPLIQSSQNKLINEVNIAIDTNWLSQFYKTIEQNYSKAPYFSKTFNLIQQVFSTKHHTISDLATESIVQVSDFLGLQRDFEISSFHYQETQGKEKAERIISICKKKGCDIYINPSGGKELYQKDYFASQGVTLSFIENQLVPYAQFENEFINGLSIIDVLMFNSVEEVRIRLTQYNLN